MEREELTKALKALRDAIDNVINTMDGQQAKTPAEGKRDTTVSEFWSALKTKDFVRAKELYKKFSSLELTEKQKELKTRMKNALVEKYNQFKSEDDLPY